VQVRSIRKPEIAHPVSIEDAAMKFTGQHVRSSFLTTRDRAEQLQTAYTTDNIATATDDPAIRESNQAVGSR